MLRAQVDGQLRTSNPDVYAIGDVAAFPLKKYGITTRQVGPSWSFFGTLTVVVLSPPIL
jgi:thioredoxin reductase